MTLKRAIDDNNILVLILWVCKDVNKEIKKFLVVKLLRSMKRNCLGDANRELEKGEQEYNDSINEYQMD